MLSAALAGITARLLCHPLDTIKTVAFTGFAGGSPASPSSSTAKNAKSSHSASAPTQRGGRLNFASAARSIWQREGVRGFYRGVGVACVGAAPGVTLYLSTYNALNEWWTALGNSAAQDPSPSLLSSAAAMTPAAVTSFCCGFAAETMSCLVWVPVDVAKERLQSQPPSLAGRYRSSLDALSTIVRVEGVTGLYRGYLSTLGSFGPFSAVYFACYEGFSQYLRRCEPGGESDTGPSYSNFFIALCAGAGGNIVASLLTNPLELVKTRLQVQRAVLRTSSAGGSLRPKLFEYEYSGLCHGLVTIAREEGVRGLWRGVGCRMAFTAPNAALTMAFFECLKEWRVG